MKDDVLPLPGPPTDSPANADSLAPPGTTSWPLGYNYRKVRNSTKPPRCAV